MAETTGVEMSQIGSAGRLGSTLLPEGVFPAFEITDVIVESGTTVLCRANHASDGSSWILYLVAPQAFRNDDHKHEFCARLTELSEVEETGLLGLVGIEWSEGWCAIVYEDFQGVPLLASLRTKMSPARAVKIVADTADAVHAAHEVGFVHRDIHPGNILIEEQGDGQILVKLACAGVVPALYASDEEFLESLNDRPNELRSYLAPEQLVPGDPSDFRADIYTLSAITYRLLVGRPPGGFTVLPSSRADVNRGTDDIVLRAMHTDRKKRYPTAAAFGADVRKVGTGNKNDPLAGLRYLKQEQAAEDRQNSFGPSRLVAMLVLMGVLAVGGVGVFAAFKFIGERERSAQTIASTSDISSTAIPKKQANELKQMRELMDKGDKEAAVAIAASMIRSSVKAGEQLMDPAAMEAAVLMTVEAGDTREALQLANIRSAKTPDGMEAVDWRRIEALTKQLEVGSEGHKRSMRQADVAKEAADYPRERLELAKASGFLPEHPAAKDRVNFGRSNYDAREDLERRLDAAVMADGSSARYAIREKDAELHLDLSNNPQLTNVAMLVGTPVTHLNISNTAVSDLSPLKGMPLQVLISNDSPVSDFSPLAGAPIRLLSAEGSGAAKLDQVLKLQMLEIARIGFSDSLAVRILPPKPGREWINSLGMRFDPVLSGDTVLMSKFETRRSDFRAFVEDTKKAPPMGMTTLLSDGSWANFERSNWDQPPFEQSDDHPVIGVSYLDADAFCKWLTQIGRASGELGSHAFYRLPTSAEWSLAAGLLTGQRRVVYPWGTEWPAARVTGNYPVQLEYWAHGELVTCDDGYLATSPVGSFRGSKFADLAGNVREWCQDEITAKADLPNRVVRGAAWGLDLADGGSYKTMMRLDYEDIVRSDSRSSNLGFRVVLDLGLGY